MDHLGEEVTSHLTTAAVVTGERTHATEDTGRHRAARTNPVAIERAVTLGPMSSRTTSIGGVISLLGAFLASALVLGLLAAGLVMPAVGATGALARSGVDVFNELPSEFTTDPLAQTSRILAADGTVIATPQEQNRTIVPLSKIAPIMREAQVAIEDHRFYEHGGIDLQGRPACGRSPTSAAARRPRAPRRSPSSTSRSPCSTPRSAPATSRRRPQAVKKDYMRKLKELKYAITLEKKLTKDQILEGYLNLVYYGDRAYGVEAAAQHYFSVHARQAEPLAGSAPRRPDAEPRHDRPGELPEEGRRPPQRRARPHARARPDHRQAVARREEAHAQAGHARARSPRARASRRPTPTGATSSSTTPWRCPQLGKTVEERKRTLYRGGVTITTTLDPRVQQDRAAGDHQEGADRQHVPQSAPPPTSPTPTPARCSPSPRTRPTPSTRSRRGKTGINWALDKKYGGSGGFQFGSTAKAFALVTAMESGMTLQVERQRQGGRRRVSMAIYTPKDWPGGIATAARASQWKVYNDTPVHRRQASRSWRRRRCRPTPPSSPSPSSSAAARCATRCCASGCTSPTGSRSASTRRSTSSAPPTSPRRAWRTPTASSPPTARSARWSPSRRSRRAARTSPLPKTTCDQVVEPDVAHATDKFLEYNMTNGSGIRNQLDDGSAPVGRQDRHGQQQQRVVVRRLHAAARRRPSGSARPTTRSPA